MLIENNNYQLGNIKYDVKKEFEVIIKNDSDFDIVITKLKPGCGSCTTANIKKAELAKGEEIPLKVTYKPNTSGLVEKLVTIHYKENNVDKNYHFIFKANVFL